MKSENAEVRESAARALGLLQDPMAIPLLLAALEDGHLAGAGLDVSEEEPVQTQALRMHPRVVWTPHVAYYSIEGYREMRLKGAEEGLRAITGRALLNPVNKSFIRESRT